MFGNYLLYIQNALMPGGQLLFFRKKVTKKLVAVPARHNVSPFLLLPTR